MDVVTAAHSLAFVGDKRGARRRDPARAPARRPPGGALLAAARARPPGPPPPLNPCGPLGLRDAEAFDALLAGAGFEFAEGHGAVDAYPSISLGPLEGEIGFKVAMLPIWDAVSEMEEDGSAPGAWANGTRAGGAHPAAGQTRRGLTPGARSPARVDGGDGRALVDAGGNCTFSGVQRFAVARKPGGG